MQNCKARDLPYLLYWSTTFHFVILIHRCMKGLQKDAWESVMCIILQAHSAGSVCVRERYMLSTSCSYYIALGCDLLSHLNEADGHCRSCSLEKIPQNTLSPPKQHVCMYVSICWLGYWLTYFGSLYPCLLPGLNVQHMVLTYRCLQYHSMVYVS